MTRTDSTYYCDNCGKQLPTSQNTMCIVTSKRESNIDWSRLRVVIERRHGVHNDAETDQADLCQQCARKLLIDAEKRVKAGERLSAGVDSPNQEGWND